MLIAQGTDGFRSLQPLMARNGGAQVLDGAAIALAAALGAWPAASGEPLDDLALRVVR